jgi:hypothetical protein
MIMAVQLIIYSIATGRARRIVDPQINVPNVIQFLAQAALCAGEAAMIYAKTGSDNVSAWQTAVNVKTSKTPSGDRYCIIDAGNNIIGVVVADPACGDSVPGCTLVAHATAGPSAGWTFSAGIFTHTYTAQELANAAAKGVILPVLS